MVSDFRVDWGIGGSDQTLEGKNRWTWEVGGSLDPYESLN